MLTHSTVGVSAGRLHDVTSRSVDAGSPLQQVYPLDSYNIFTAELMAYYVRCAGFKKLISTNPCGRIKGVDNEAPRFLDLSSSRSRWLFSSDSAILLPGKELTIFRGQVLLALKKIRMLECSILYHTSCEAVD
jgi:hypothetical protein